MSARPLPILAGLIGWPVAQSKSPLIHRFWFECTAIDGEYIRIPVAPGDVEAALRSLPALGFAGVQATMPHKRACFEQVDSLTPAARALGVVNTVIVEGDGRLLGHNTDFAGFLEPLATIDLTGTCVTVLGAGGAAVAIVAALASKAPARINLVNRSPGAIDRLCTDLAPLLGGIEMVSGDWSLANDFASHSALVVNASALGMNGHPPLPLDPACLRENGLVYDIVTSPHQTPLVLAARARGLTCFDGLHMLVGQAREAFTLFYGVEPPASEDARLRARLIA